MKKKLFIIFVFIFSLFISLGHTNHIYATSIIPTPTTGVDTSIANGDWLPDADVTFQGKTASRSALLMNLVLTNYQWATATGEQSLITFWTTIRNVVYAILLLVLLAAAFAIIISGGKSLTAWTFARRFIIMVVLIWFSYALTRFLYEIVDIIIGFFNRNPEGAIITSKDLFNMSFNYQYFIGLRRFGSDYNESAFVSLLLVRLTAITYYVMAGILLVRKIILWFFIAVSPIYPLLLFHFPIRNTAKIWIGEFFRWLLYAPLFFIFLSSLVIVWRHNIDLFPFNFATKDVVYPTSINILLGGPGQQLDIKNSVNYNDTFAEYVIALIMLWIVIFLPFILLRIFLDYLSNININKDNPLNYLQNIVKRVPGNQLFFPSTPVAPVSPAPPPGTRPTGMAKPILVGTTGSARELPFGEKREMYVEKPTYTTIQHPTTVNVQTPAYKSEKTTIETAKLVSFPIPRMTDIARFETSRTSSSVTRTSDISRMQQTLQKIAAPASITNTVERQQFTQLRDQLVQQSQRGEPLATSILNAANNVTKVSVAQNQEQVIKQVQQRYANVVNPQSVTMEKIAAPDKITNQTERQQFTTLKQQLLQESKKGDSVATSILSAADNSVKVGHITSQTTLPQVNQVQTVNLEDYEEVKKTWLENYKKMEVPKTADATERTRRQWIEHDATRLSRTIDLLTSKDQPKVDEGMKEVSSLLPFLLIGGFSQTEVVSYLQAKKHAADEALTQIKESENEEDTLVDTKARQAEAVKHLTTTATVNTLGSISGNSNEENEEGNPLSEVVSRYTQRIKEIKQVPQLKSEVTSSHTMKLVNFPIPTMRDVARYETNKFTSEKTAGDEATKVSEMLQKLANPDAITNSDEKQQFVLMKQQLVDAGQKGDPLANSILFTVNIISKAGNNPQKITQSGAVLPQTNQVQTVNLDDYETIRQMWHEIYKSSEVSTTQDNPNADRKTWIENDIKELSNTISMLKSNDQNQIAEGMKEVGSLLPFLLIGGFSQTEVAAYLQAKMQAGQDVLQELSDQEKEEESKVAVSAKKIETNTQTQQQEIGKEEKK